MTVNFMAYHEEPSTAGPCRVAQLKSVITIVNYSTNIGASQPSNWKDVQAQGFCVQLHSLVV